MIQSLLQSAANTGSITTLWPGETVKVALYLRKPGNFRRTRELSPEKRDGKYQMQRPFLEFLDFPARLINLLD